LATVPDTYLLPNIDFAAKATGARFSAKLALEKDISKY
jgi:hypothetical protein